LSFTGAPGILTYMTEIIVVSETIDFKEIKDLAKEGFGDMVKGVVDIEKCVIALGGELHADEEAYLLERGSEQRNLWGFNIYPELEETEMIEYDSMINIRPQQGNRSRTVEDQAIQKKISDIVSRLIKW
jgi:hypothetical protein